MVSADDVQRHHIDGVFVDNDEYQQRGAVVGLKSHAYRQVLSLMLGAHICDIEYVNVACNYGGLTLRISSDPCVMDENGNDRTLKSISPVQ